MIDTIQTEILFNSVEVELDRRWAFANVPTPFVHRPALHLRMTVKAWWQLYHESTCARQQRNRFMWERNPAYPAKALETSALAASLQKITTLLNLDELLTYRSLSKAEESGLCLLALLSYYYRNPQGERWKQIV